MGLFKMIIIASLCPRYIIEVTRSDKLDNKLSNKPDADLSEVVEAWPEGITRSNAFSDCSDCQGLSRAIERLC